ncbi:hypothetical protein ACKVWC_000245 [Pyricularia oryzae]
MFQCGWPHMHPLSVQVFSARAVKHLPRQLWTMFVHQNTAWIPGDSSKSAPIHLEPSIPSLPRCSGFCRLSEISP